MYHFGLVLVLVTVHGALLTPKNLHPDFGLNIVDLVTKYGYSIESHHVETDDGYILTLHRIPSSSNKKVPVLLMHGLLSSSVDWVNMGPGTSLALLLADEGYDVWLGNQRGNTWSRKHDTLDPDQDAEKFFDFSFHEIGVNDLPAKIDHILANTSQEQLVYVGHSQGTTDFFVMGSEKPEYNEKIKLMVALAPVAYLGKIPHPFIPHIVNYSDLINMLLPIFEIHEFLPHREYISELGKYLCNRDSAYQNTCLWFLNLIGGFDSQIDPDFVPVIMTNAPAGSSIRQILHAFQLVQSGNFAQYDYGTENFEKYGTKGPPSYNLSKIIAPVILHYASNDWLTSVEDVLQLSGELPNLVNATQVPLDSFNHLEFLWAQNIVDLLYNDVIAEIKAVD